MRRFLAPMTLDDIGPTPTRKGERTRQRILTGAIGVIATHGIEGSTHRAVATAAGVSLSTTTYHFSTLEDLLVQTFELIVCERNNKSAATLAAVRHRVVAAGLAPDSPPAMRLALCDELAKTAVDFLYDPAPERRTLLAAELRMVYEAGHIPRLQQRVDRYRAEIVDRMRLLPELAGSQTPDLDAAIIFDAIQTMQFRALFRPHEATRDALTARARRHVGWLLGCC